MDNQVKKEVMKKIRETMMKYKDLPLEVHKEILIEVFEKAMIKGILKKQGY